MTLANWLGSVRRPTALTVTVYGWFGDSGAAPMLPAATCTFCSCRALSTSEAASPRALRAVGFSQTRIAKRR